MPWIVEGYEDFIGQVAANGQCVRLLQECGLPHTSQWRAGEKVRGSGCERGTAIATFSAAGRYENRTDGTSHAAIFLEELPDGLKVVDQWSGHHTQERVIHYRGGNGRRVNDGDAFCVIETD